MVSPVFGSTLLTLPSWWFATQTDPYAKVRPFGPSPTGMLCDTPFASDGDGSGSGLNEGRGEVAPVAEAVGEEPERIGAVGEAPVEEPPELHAPATRAIATVAMSNTAGLRCRSVISFSSPSAPVDPTARRSPLVLIRAPMSRRTAPQVPAAD